MTTSNESSNPQLDALRQLYTDLEKRVEVLEEAQKRAKVALDHVIYREKIRMLGE